METIDDRRISVTEPIGHAVNKTKQILFSPFSLEKWFVLGFCAWLAGLGGGGGGGGVNYHGGSSSGSSSCPSDVHRVGQEIGNYVSQNLPWLLPVAIAIVLLIVVISFIVIWLKSRGQFMFLDCIVHNRGAIAAPWTEYRADGNSLFVFKLLLWLAGFVLTLAAIIPLIFIAMMFVRNEFRVFLVGPAIAGGLLLLALMVMGVVFGVVKVLTEDFVVPVMYLRRSGVKAAWKECLGLFSARPGAIVLYLLFLLVIGIVLSTLTFLCMMSACCIFCCVAWVFLIPFVGGYLMAVVLLPLEVWRRSYSVLFLSQFGPDYNVFAPAEMPLEPVSAEIESIPTESGPESPIPPSEGQDI